MLKPTAGFPAWDGFGVLPVEWDLMSSISRAFFPLFSSAPVPSEFTDPICFLETGFFFFLNLSGEREKCLRNTNELLLSGTL